MSSSASDNRAGGWRYWRADVGSPADRAALVEGVTGAFGAIDALVNNAGRAPRVRADLLDASEESFEDLIRTNLQGPVLPHAGGGAPDGGQDLGGRPATTSEVGSATAEVFSPALVFITSVSAELASPNRGEYCVSKAGLAMAVKLFATKLAPHGVSVYEVRPGIIQTDMTAGVRDIYDRRIADGLVPAGRWGTPADVGRTVAALLRGDVPYATGSVIHVDGGLSVGRL